MKLKPLPPNPTPAQQQSRRTLLLRGYRSRSEIDQMHRDLEYWNESVRQPHEPVIPCDPDGTDAQWVKELDELLNGELWCVHIGGPDEVHAAPTWKAAEERCLKLNDHFEKLRDGNTNPNFPVLKASVDLWPHSAESHEEDLKDWN